MTAPAWMPDVTSETFTWDVPSSFNIAADSLDNHPADAPAIIDHGAGGAITTFGELRDRSRKLARWMLDQGLEAGDRVAIFLPQCWELPAIHYACYYAGLITVPLTTKFGEEAISTRIRDAGVKMIFGRNADLDRVRSALEATDTLQNTIAVDRPVEPGAITFEQILSSDTREHPLGSTRADDPALLIYTSGTTGPPKGALHAHRMLIGHVPCIRMTFDGFPRNDDIVWTPAEWAWIGGLVNTLLVSLAAGTPVVANDAQVSPELCVTIIDEAQVTCGVLPPTVLKQMRALGIHPQQGTLRAVGSGGENVGQELHAWAADTFGVPVNEVYGQTENNLIVCQWRQHTSYPDGSMGSATPGFDVQIMGSDGELIVDGSIGEIVVRQPNPSTFLRYWNHPEATKAKTIGPWLRTGDRGRMNDAGHLWYEGRTDDVISSSGYRVGPGEIEATLLEHPAVALAAVVGEPDTVRGQAIVAHVVLAPTYEASDDLAASLQSFVKNRLAFYQYPRKVHFHDELPMTTTGKILRRALRDA